MAHIRTRIGMLTPSSNTVLEPCVSAMLHDVPDVTAHFQRFTVKEISLDHRAEAQFSDRPLVEAAKLLNDARMNVIAWAGTAAGWRGFGVDSKLCSEITAATGAPATSSVLALNEVLQRTGVRRLGLVTPYIDEVQARIVANYTAAGYSVIGERHLGDRGNFSFCEYEGDTIAAMIRDVVAGNNKERPEAIVILCTNFRGASLVPMLERELGIPLYDSISVTVWKALTMTGHSPTRLAGWGRLFAELD
jgi:maleate isomerase